MQQKGVMPLVRGDIDKADPGGNGVQGLDDDARFRTWVEPVRGKGHHAKSRLCPPEGIRQRIALSTRMICRQDQNSPAPG